MLEDGGVDLYVFAERHTGMLKRDLIAAVTHGMLSGLQSCNEHRICHRDIKPENVLIGGPTCKLLLDAVESSPLSAISTGASAPDKFNLQMLGLQIRLCDFGISALLPSGNGRLHRCCGSLGFMAPELLDSAGYDGGAADMWSAGCVLLEVGGRARREAVCGRAPREVELASCRYVVYPDVR